MMGSLGASLIVPVLVLVFCGLYGFSNRFVPANEMMLVTPVTIALVALCLIEFVRAVLKAREQSRTRQKVIPLLYTIAIVAFAFGAQFDFILSGIMFTAVSLILTNERRPIVLLANAVSCPLVLFILFKIIMGVPLTSFLWSAFEQ